MSELARRSIAPYLDEDGLGPGDRWRTVLYHWLAACDGGILVLTPMALDRPWVSKEATILAWRAALCPGFLLVPVLIGRVTIDLVRAAFPAIGVEESEFVQLPDGASLEAIAAAATEIVARFPGGLDDDDMRRWVRDLDGHFGPVGEGRLEKLASDLGIPLDEWRVTSDRRRRLAYEILHTEGNLLNLEKPIEDIVRYVDTPGPFITRLAPIGVPTDATAAVLEVFRRPRGERVAALCGHWGPTAYRWVNRAICGSESYRQGECSPTLEGGDAVAEVCQAVRTWLVKASGAMDYGGVARQLEHTERKPGRCVLVLPMRTEERLDALRSEVVRRVVEQMRAEQPLLVQIVLTGPSFDVLDDLGMSDVARIEPGPRDVGSELDDLGVVNRLLGLVTSP